MYEYVIVMYLLTFILMVIWGGYGGIIILLQLLYSYIRIYVIGVWMISLRVRWGGGGVS